MTFMSVRLILASSSSASASSVFLLHRCMHLGVFVEFLFHCLVFSFSLLSFIRSTARPSFKHFQTPDGNSDQASVDYFDMSSRLLQELGLITEDNAIATAFTGLTTCFELRTYGVAESLAVLDSLPLFMQDFVNHKPPDYGEKVTFLLIFIHVLESVYFPSF